MIVVQFNAAFFGKGRSNITSNANNNNSLEKLAFMRLYRIVKYVHAIHAHIDYAIYRLIIQWLSRYSIIGYIFLALSVDIQFPLQFSSCCMNFH